MSIKINEYDLIKTQDFDDNIIINASKILIDKTFLLNSQLDYDNALEKFIYNIANYHMVNEQQTISFRFINCKNIHAPENKCVLDQNLNKNNNSESLCIITYLTNSNVTTVVSEMNIDKYKYKQFLNTSLVISSHKKYKQLVFDNRNHIYCYSNISTVNDYQEDIMLLINIWDAKPNNIPYFNYSIFQEKYGMNYADTQLNQNFDSIKIIPRVSNTIILDDYFSDIVENMFYNNDHTVYKGQLINYLNDNAVNIDADHDIVYLKNIEPSAQHVKVDKILDINTCDWIINEYTDYVNNNSMVSFDNKLDVDNIQNITRLLLLVFKTKIMNHIASTYSLDIDSEVNILDFSFVKYDIDNNNNNIFENYKDKRTVKILIALNNNDNIFIDDILKPTAGDMLLFTQYTRRILLLLDNTVRPVYALMIIVNINVLQ